MGEVWCLVRGDETLAHHDSAAGSRPCNSRWWLLSQLDVEDKPIPLQRRWKGEVAALRTQNTRFKKKAEDLEAEFETYKSKANAALTSTASQGEEIQLRERKLEQLGEQLQ